MAKLKVHADADDVLIEFDGATRSRRGSGGGGGGVIAATISVIAGYISDQVNKEEFDLGSPIVGERPFQSATDCPAEFRVGLRRQTVQPGLHIRAGASGGAIDEDAIPRVAKARPERSDPSACGLAAQPGCRRRGRRDSVRSKKTGAKRTATGSLKILPIKVAFDAQHPCAELAAHSYGAADQTAVDLKVPSRTKARRIERVASPLALAKRVA